MQVQRYSGTFDRENPHLILGVLPYTKESWMDVGKPASERANTYTHANYDMVSILFRSVLKERK